MKIQDLLFLYRIRNWRKKVTWTRHLGYLFLAYALAAKLDLRLIFLNTLAISGIFMFVYSMNDYFDFLIQGERTFIGEQIRKGKLNRSEARIYGLLPLFLCLPLFLFEQISWLTLALLLLGFLIASTYSLPPLRYKEKNMLRFIAPPSSATILFLEAYTVLMPLDRNILLLAILIFFFHCYLESLHLLEHSQTKKALKLVRGFPLVSLALSIGFSLLNPLFLNTSLFSLPRIKAAERLKVRSAFQERTNLFSPLLSLYEFGIYAILGIFNLF